MRNQEVGDRAGRSCCACLGIMNDRQGWHRLVVAARQGRLNRLVQQQRPCGALKNIEAIVRKKETSR